MELVEKLSKSFDLDRVRTDVLSIIGTYNYPQIGLTHSPKTTGLSMEERMLECTGSIMDYDTKVLKFKETDFTEFNEDFKNTYLYEIYKSVPNVGRFRIMVMNGPSCYTIHRDLSKRYHYVIETNPNCLFLFPGVNKMYHIPMDGNLYLTDTRYRHTFVNGSRGRRIHLVLDDLSTLEQK